MKTGLPRNNRTLSAGLLIALLVALFACGSADRAAGEELQTFSLPEYLDHDWSNELLTFPLSAESTQALDEGITLVGADGGAGGAGGRIQYGDKRLSADEPASKEFQAEVLNTHDSKQ